MAGFSRRWARKAGRKWSELQNEYEDGKNPGDDVIDADLAGDDDVSTTEFDFTIPLSETEELDPAEGADPA